MLDFITAITNETTTLNGAATNKSSLNKCLDLFSMGVSSHNKENLIIEALKEDFILATKVVFYLRDVRNGQGNKDIARAYHKIMRTGIEEKAFRKKYLKLLPYLPEIGSWKDVYEMYGLHKKVNKKIRKLVTEALYANNGLAAKWFPRQSQLHKDLAAELEMDIGGLRRMVTKLTNVVETQMCNKQWHEIKYESVPSIANKKYSKAFLVNDGSRRQAFLDKATKGETTMKASVLYPHDIFSMLGTRFYGKIDNASANALWANLPNYMESSEKFGILPIIDTSASMTWTKCPGTNVMPLQVAFALGMYFAERNEGVYKDLWCTFNTTPQFRQFKGKTLSDKASQIDMSGVGGSTNIEAVFDKILQYGDLENAPKLLLIVSDMEFNSCGGRKTNYEKAKAKFAAAGIPMPTVLFWRVDTKTNQQPVTMYDENTIMISGYSPSFMKEVLKMDLESIKQMTPLNMMKKTVEDRYPFVNKIYA